MGMDRLEIHWFESSPPNFASSGFAVGSKLALIGFSPLTAEPAEKT
jgi:hypothetical protein